MLYTLRLFSSKCSLFHNANFFGSVLFTFYIQGVLKLKKNNNSGAKGLNSKKWMLETGDVNGFQNCDVFWLTVMNTIL